MAWVCGEAVGLVPTPFVTGDAELQRSRIMEVEYLLKICFLCLSGVGFGLATIQCQIAGRAIQAISYTFNWETPAAFPIQSQSPDDKD